MTPFNLRSLLLAAIFLCNCISWTTSRHHYTHNVNGHRSRHRRQGAGLFLSASYVLPGGEGSGWGEWGEVSPCSRTCGGGVASQKRICLQIGADGQPLCPGGDTKYFSCQTQDCPAGSKDFRAEQCSEFDDVLFRDIKYKWVPYTKAPNPCELNCMPHAERFYYRHKAKVIDGTRCSDQSFDVCVNGTCQPVGCDMMLGSSAKEDKCRECRGNNANCHTTSGILDTTDLTKGYNDMLLIPEGSTSIVIEELGPTTNYLALRAQNSTFYLNGDYHIDFPRNLEIGGVMWTYERSQQGFAAPDKLRSLGPTNEPIYLSLLLQDENVGIQYEYSLPTEMAPPQNKRYNWVHEEFTPCSASCGGGFQTRRISCRSSEELEVVSEGLCDEGLRPPTNQSCNTQACDPQWVSGPWGQCSKRCGKGGTSSREITCQKIISNGYPSIVADNECFELLGPKPKLFQECNENATCPKWFTGPWKPCNKRCDEGKQSRQVVCYQKNGRKIEVLGDEECEEPRPETEQSCMVQPCDGVDWVTSEWNGCDSCQSTIRTRTIVCATKNHVVVDDKFCSYHRALSTQETCDATKLPPCSYQWYATQWSNCSAKCGEGIQSRSVFCGQFDGSSVTKVDDSKCADQPKYEDSKPCKVPEEDCPMQWFTAPWSACSKTCGGGERERRVMCLRGEEMASNCPGVAPLPYENCNTQPCTDAPLEELEDCVDEEPYIEVGLDDEVGGFTADAKMFSDGSSEDSSFWTTVYEAESNFTDTDSTISTDDFGNFEGSGSTWTDTTLDSSTTDSDTDDIGSGTTETLTDDTETMPTDGTDESSESTGPTDATETSSEATEISSGATEISSEATETSSEATEISSGATETSSEATEISSESSPTSNSSATDSAITDSSDTSETSASSDESDDGFSTSSGDTDRPTYPLYDDETDDDSGIETTTSGVTVRPTYYLTDETSETIVTGSSDSETADTGTTESETTDTSGSTETSESPTTDSTETTESEITTESTSSTEKGETTESEPTETTETTESGSTDSEATEFSTTENIVSSSIDTTELGSTETTESSSTEMDSSTSASTETSETKESGPTETSETTESGSTETSETTESGPTETSETTESGPTEISDTTESGSTETSETTESGPTETNETTESGSTETSETTESGSTETSETTESGSTETTESGPTETSETTESGSTETSETTESGSTETSETTESGPTETSETTESGSTETSETTESGSTETSENTESGSTETTESTSALSSSDSDSSTDDDLDISTTYAPTTSSVEWFTPKKPRMCKPRLSCHYTEFGCCPDMKTSAGGPFDEGCEKPIESCKQSEFGCCPDGVSSSPTVDGQGCPMPACSETLFGCCLSDNKTAAEGNDQEGCPPPQPACVSSEFGCCKDGETQATGPAKEGCPETTVPETEPPTTALETTLPETESSTTSDISMTGSSTSPAHEGCESSEFGCCFDNVTEATGLDQQGCPCNISQFGCCSDGVAAAQGPSEEGCLKNCNSSTYGCCPDGMTPAHGPNSEGCCMHSPFGCCPDNYNHARGPHLEGCECQYSPYGCCPDNVTSATGYDNKGCGCTYSPHGCCPDAHTDASGPDFEGCACHTYQFGCCPDGVTIASGPQGQGCHCLQSKYKCCGDGETHATGPNHEGCDCSSSKYGCCPDGRTEATGSRFQGCTDAPENRQAACGLKYARGPCRNYSVSWYFDNEYGGCSRFWYGGCEGNGNRFTSTEECEDVCVSPSPKDVCKLPQSKGPCPSYNVRWYYDSERESCVNFVYGGCLGNNNNFETRELCQKQCEPEKSTEQCSLPIERGSCAGNFPRWGFNQESRTCEQFVWGGCEGNPNRFSTEAACNLQCNPPGQPKPECSQPQATGTSNCTETEAVWSFSQSENRCVPFYFTGCGGNENIFTTKEECARDCPSAYVPDKCTIPYDTGKCANYREQWYFDTKHQRCRQFYYGGCGGNENNFMSEQECQRECQPIPSTTTARPTTVTQRQPRPYFVDRQDFCFLEMDVGPCTDFKTKWGYDYKTGRCTTFQYGGCGGNRNNFPDEQYCQYYCNVTQDICQLPMLTGPCDDSQMKWFYDASTDSCSQFTYGGCEGNDNRFESRGECESRCGPTTQQTATTVAITTAARPKEILPDICIISSTLEACSREQAGEFWYLSTATQECVPHQNLADGDNCRTTGVFSSQEGCERSCGAFRGIDVCSYPPEAGICNRFTPKYFFNGTSGRCEEFAYGGCMGGPNRFSTELECFNICKPTGDPCTQQPEPGNCLARYDMWYYNKDDDQCSQFIYGGCGGNENRFETREACEGRCKQRPGEDTIPAPTQASETECVTPVSLEPCGTNETAFYYNAETSTCRVADHGACKNIPNRYESEEECERRCGAFRGLDACRTKVDPGPCRAAITKYYFDIATGSCNEFAYGGCQGGPNRFSTIDECEDNCKELGPAAACLQEVSTGEPCRASPSRRWHYSAVRAGCLVFAYQGCGGNDNNFRSYDECATVCKLNPIDSEAQAELCNRYSEECEALEGKCEFGIRITVASAGCQQCSCEPPSCDQQQQVCQALSCSYGVETTTGGDGCVSCKCAEDPCLRANCAATERCVPSAYREPETQAVRYSAQCIPAAHTAPVTSLETQPEQSATLGGKATLRCIFHGNPPPKITWRFGQIQIDSDQGRYRLLADGALTIESVVRADSGVYVCVAYNDLGSAQQEIQLIVNDPEPTTNPCDSYRDECESVRSTCTFNLMITSDSDGCERCSCEPPNCDRQRHECDTLQCSYGVEKISEDDGCERCRCAEDPCLRANCSASERCVASAYREPTTQAVIYSAHCVPDTDTNEVLPECEQDEEYCARLVCPYGVQKVVTSRGCVRCTCIQVQVNCTILQQECDNLECNYGVERSRSQDGCERCKCLPDPCNNQECKANERCVRTHYRDPISREDRLRPECRSVEKAGVCPVDRSRSTESACMSQCTDDADCRGVGKCCVRGCSRLCITPDETTLPPTTLAPVTTHVTTYKPDIPLAPSVSAETEPQQTVAEGDKATLRCIFHGNPPPQISWQFGKITINGDHDRYRLLADGALEIVSLVRADSGVYVCVAYNDLGSAQQEIRLMVSDPVLGQAYIAGDDNAVAVGELGRPLRVRCHAYGFPNPAIYWYRGREMVPYSNSLYEARDVVLTIRHLAEDTLGEYTCFAYNGQGKAATWVVTVRAYQPDENAIGPYYVPRDRVVQVTPPRPQPTARLTTVTTTIMPEIQTPPYIVPVSTELQPASTTISAGTELSLPCNVDGNPEPRVTWSKDGVLLTPTDTMWITGARLTIPRATISDSGLYECRASNEYSSHSSTVQITVQEIVIPSKCTDSAYFANCALIVQGRFCRHKYYSRFCCKSCVEAGQLDPNDVDMQSDEPYKKK